MQQIHVCILLYAVLHMVPYFGKSFLPGEKSSFPTEIRDSRSLHNLRFRFTGIIIFYLNIHEYTHTHIHPGVQTQNNIWKLFRIFYSEILLSNELR